MTQEVVNPSEEFRYGSELQGRGYMTRMDTYVGLSIWVLASTAVIIGLLNLYLIKKLNIFHNSFGALWVSRTIGEIASNLPNIFYAGPVTIFQPKDIDPAVGIVAWTVAFFFGFESCIMIQSVSANRMIAVCAPQHYYHIFSKRLTAILITVTWIVAAFVISLYYLVPCSVLGYSPQYHEYLFIKLALILFNPEVHEFLGVNIWCLRKKRISAIPCTMTAVRTVAKIDN
ncbi:hypothetical protein QR680_014170 [Steinernema hermaphroditum]|uniref:7TM GPCR serpentine receptor class x (Srx) domain-containing protein n=1 Tax=Steinernema hermaphroditum TaxID=289476 RepID=A0AA39I7X7_9BILA|nr:hypothetical protein QR680_014170 [Steinernema hermaphroditum]